MAEERELTRRLEVLVGRECVGIIEVEDGLYLPSHRGARLPACTSRAAAEASVLRRHCDEAVARAEKAEAALRWGESHPGATHYDGCESEHRGCALARLAEVEEELDVCRHHRAEDEAMYADGITRTLAERDEARRVAQEWRNLLVSSIYRQPWPDHLPDYLLPWERAE